ATTIAPTAVRCNSCIASRECLTACCLAICAAAAVADCFTAAIWAVEHGATAASAVVPLATVVEDADRVATRAAAVRIRAALHSTVMHPPAADTAPAAARSFRD